MSPLFTDLLHVNWNRDGRKAISLLSFPVGRKLFPWSMLTGSIPFPHLIWCIFRTPTSMALTAKLPPSPAHPTPHICLCFHLYCSKLYFSKLCHPHALTQCDLAIPPSTGGVCSLPLWNQAGFVNLLSCIQWREVTLPDLREALQLLSVSCGSLDLLPSSSASALLIFWAE